MVAQVVDVTGTHIALHRTYLAPDGRGKAAVPPPRATLGLVAGGTIRLAELSPDRRLVIGEGVGTSASAGLLLGAPAWAAIFAGNLERGLALPHEVVNVDIAVDPDAPGRKAARAAGQRWRREGRLVLAAGVTFWSAADDQAYATVKDGTRTCRYRVASQAFAKVVRRIYGQAHPVCGKGGSRPGSVSISAVNEVIPALEAMAIEGDVRRPEVRVGEYDGAVWLDLGSPDWHLIRITAEGWELVGQADVPLVRSGGIEPLPNPKHDPNALTKLRALLNIQDDTTLRLIVAWMVAALFPKFHCPCWHSAARRGRARVPQPSCFGDW